MTSATAAVFTTPCETALCDGDRTARRDRDRRRRLGAHGGDRPRRRTESTSTSLEARTRLGGRIATGAVAGLSVETGGEFLDAVDSPFSRFLAALGVELETASHEKQPTRGAVVLGGEQVRPSPRALELVAALDAEIERIAAAVDPEAPWESEGAGALDALSIAGFVRDRGGDAEALALVEAIYAIGGSTVPTAVMSLLAMGAKQARRGPPKVA